MFQTSLSPEALRGALSRLRSGHSVSDRTGGRGASTTCHARQPIHTVYGGAHLFKADTARKLGAVALGALEEHAPAFAAFARALGLPGADELPERPAEALALAAALDAGALPAGPAAGPARLAWAVHARV